MNALWRMGETQRRMVARERYEACVNAGGKGRLVLCVQACKEGEAGRVGQCAKEGVLIDEAVGKQRLGGLDPGFVRENHRPPQQGRRNSMIDEEGEFGRDRRKMLVRRTQLSRKFDLTLQCHKRYPKNCQFQTWP